METINSTFVGIWIYILHKSEIMWWWRRFSNRWIPRDWSRRQINCLVHKKLWKRRKEGNVAACSRLN